MKITRHLTYYYDENTKSRIKYINNTINEINNGIYKTDIYIHTNYLFQKDLLNNNNKGIVEIVVHKLLNPMYLPWKCRDLLKKQKDEYDIFMYHEDDILVPNEAINYWLKYKDLVMKENYNLGFFRIEKDKNGIEYTTDNSTMPGEYSNYLTKGINLNDIEYIINDQNPYCAFWIYDKNEFTKFINSHLYDINNIRGYGERESSAIGLHGLFQNTNWYKGTIVPIIDNMLIKSCRIYHLTNNYINGSCPASRGLKERGWRPHRFDEVLKYYS